MSGCGIMFEDFIGMVVEDVGWLLCVILEKLFLGWVESIVLVREILMCIFEFLMYGLLDFGKFC